MRIYLTKHVLLLIMLSMSDRVSAQINIEKYRAVSPDSGFSGNVEIELSSRTGNVEETTLTLENRADYIRDSMKTFLVAVGDYGWQGGERYSDEALAHIRHIFRLKENWQPELFAQIDYNKKRQLEFRGLYGGGIRYALLRSTTKEFWFGTSGMMEYERLDLEAGDAHDTESTVIRWSSYLTENVTLNDRIRFGSTTYIQPRIDDFGDIRILCESDLQIELFKRISFMISFKIRYDSEPPGKTESLDTALKTGLVFGY